MIDAAATRALDISAVVALCRMKPPISFASSHLFARKLRAEVSRLRGVLSSWLTAALISSGLSGVGILVSGIIAGALLHKSAYIVGGVLAVLCLILFAAVQEAWAAIGLWLGLLEFDDLRSSREEVLKHLNNCVHKRKPAVLPSNADFDDVILHAMKGLPSRLVTILAKSLQAGPAIAALLSVICAVYIFMSDIPDLISTLPIILASLAASGAIGGIAVQMRARVILRNIAVQEIELTDCHSGATLLELHMNMLRRKLASTAEGTSWGTT